MLGKSFWIQEHSKTLSGAVGVYACVLPKIMLKKLVVI